MILRHCRPGVEVLTPMGREAVILRVMTGSNEDQFDRVKLKYLDVPEDTWMGSHLVALQPKLLTSLEDTKIEEAVAMVGSGDCWKEVAKAKRIPLGKMFMQLHCA